MKKINIFCILIIVSIIILFGCDMVIKNTNSSENPSSSLEDLPPDPGKEGKKTLEGIDSDNDGVRDDIQRHIALTELDQLTQKMLTKQAKAQQSLILSDGNKEKAMNAAIEEDKAMECLYYINPDNASDILDEVDFLMTNTEERVRAYFAADALLSGEIFQSMSDDELAEMCE